MALRKEIVELAAISSNIDAPEGTLDGLLQSIVCSNIGKQLAHIFVYVYKSESQICL